MSRFEENNQEERALIPNVMLPIPRNSIKITEIDRKKVIHALIMNNNPHGVRNLLTQCTKYIRKKIYNDN